MTTEDNTIVAELQKMSDVEIDLTNAFLTTIGEVDLKACNDDQKLALLDQLPGFSDLSEVERAGWLNKTRKLLKLSAKQKREAQL